MRHISYIERSVRVGRRRAQCCRNQDAGEELCGRVFVKETRGVRKGERLQEKRFSCRRACFAGRPVRKAEMQAFSSGGCAAKEDAGGLHGQVEEGAAKAGADSWTKRILLRRRKNIPSGQGSGRDIFAERRAESVCLTGPRPKAADRCQRGDFAQSGETRMCLRMALRGGVASGFGESRTRGLV